MKKGKEKKANRGLTVQDGTRDHLCDPGLAINPVKGEDELELHRPIFVLVILLVLLGLHHHMKVPKLEPVVRSLLSQFDLGFPSKLVPVRSA